MAHKIKQRDSIAKGPTMKKTTPMLSLATIMSIITAPFQRPETMEVKAVQMEPIPEKTGNALYDFLNYANAHFFYHKGFRTPATKKEKTRKGATHKYSKSNRNAVQLRDSIYGIVCNKSGQVPA